MVATDETTYLRLAENTIQKQSGPLNWWPEGGGDFRADSTDDTGRFGIASLVFQHTLLYLTILATSIRAQCFFPLLMLGFSKP